MKELTIEQLERLQGGDTKACIFSAIGLGVSIIGGIFSFATLNPFGVAASVVGIYAGGASTIISCGLA